MKFKLIVLSLITGLFMMANVAIAQSPREQFQQMVEELKKDPSNIALRTKIIKHAQELKPAPSVPDEAIEYEGRGQFAFKNAKSEADYLAAAKEYEKANDLAPWVPGYYDDLCTIYEKAGKLEDAKFNCECYLTSLYDPSQINDAKRRIAGLKYGIEQRSPAIIASKELDRDKQIISSLNGTRYVYRYYPPGGDGSYNGFAIDIRGDEVVFGSFGLCKGCTPEYHPWSEDRNGRVPLNGRQFRKDFISEEDGKPYTESGTISEDGNSIVLRTWSGSKIIYHRER